MTIRVERGGLLTTVQDLGRRGHQREGVPEGGAMDPFALQVANLLVGNDPGAAGLEITLAGPTLAFERAVLVALAGGDLGAHVGGERLRPWRAALVPAGGVLSFDGAAAGCRAYLGVAGGVAVPAMLGSRSTYLRAAIGGVEGRALRAGDVLPLGAPPPLALSLASTLGHGAAGVVAARWGWGPSARPPYSAAPTVRVMAGTHAPALTPASRARLLGDEFRVGPQSDRMGYRLEGPPLELSAPLELLSEAVAFGTVQLPPGGSPIVLMADRQTTGGYPRIAQVATVDLPLLAQLKPGDHLRLREISLDQAHALYLARERDLAQARQAIALRCR